MALETSPLPRPAASVSPFLIVVTAILSQTCAGTKYWWPAITPGLSHHLGFSAAQSAAIVATVNSGSTLGLLGGFFHARFGSRTTTAVAATTLSLCFATLSHLAAGTSPDTAMAVNVAFAITLLLSLLVVTFSYMVYSSALTVSAAVFPPMFRGRIVGLNSAGVGGAAGVLACVQAAFFPRLSDTAAMLRLVSLLCFTVACLALATFPAGDHRVSYRVDLSTVPTDEEPLFTDDDMRSNSAARHISNRLSRLYVHAWVFVITLQAGALADNFEAPRSVIVFMAFLILCALFAMLSVPARTPLRAQSVAGGTEIVPSGEDGTEQPGFREVMRDRRHQLLCLSGFVLVAGGGVALLVQAPIIVAAWEHGRGTLPKEGQTNRVSAGVRALVSLFAACNITARLAVGSIMDWGSGAEARELWKFRLFHNNALAMGCGLALLGAAWRPLGLVGVAMVGASYGIFFALAPALTAVWFGVRLFPLNFAIIGPFIAVGAATLSSSFPAWLRGVFGSWFIVGGNHPHDATRKCEGIACMLPAMAALALLQVGLYTIGQTVWPLVRSKAAARR